jgi:hypothetical protein
LSIEKRIIVNKDKNKTKKRKEDVRIIKRCNGLGHLCDPCGIIQWKTKGLVSVDGEVFRKITQESIKRDLSTRYNLEELPMVTDLLGLDPTKTADKEKIDLAYMNKDAYA